MLKSLGNLNSLFIFTILKCIKSVGKMLADTIIVNLYLVLFKILSQLYLRCAFRFIWKTQEYMRKMLLSWVVTSYSLNYTQKLDSKDRLIRKEKKKSLFSSRKFNFVIKVVLGFPKDRLRSTKHGLMFIRKVRYMLDSNIK